MITWPLWCRVRTKLTIAVIVSFATITGSTSTRASEKLFEALKNGRAFAIMRHAIAPGMGDPSNFMLGKCSTQRNLSESGRAQARKAGRLFLDNGIRRAAVFSSQWCRCRDTARLLGIGEINELAALNSFHGKFERRTSQTRALREFLAKFAGSLPLVLVTHQVNIRALTGRGARSGEILFIDRTSPGHMRVRGTIVP